MKQCIKCNLLKPIEEFYCHALMKDGHLSKCKECTKKDIKENREKNKDYYKEYDKIRDRLPHRIEARKKYQQEHPDKMRYYREKYAENNKDKIKSLTKKYRKENPEKYKATTLCNNKQRSGKIIKQPCAICGDTNVHAHHHDYSKPLDVVWLCPKHHKEEHMK